MSRHMKWTVLTTAIFLSMPAGATERSEFNIAVTQEVDAKAGDATLHFDLTYNGHQPVKIRTSSVPAAQDTAIWILAERFLDIGSSTRGDCPRLKEIIFIDDGKLGNTTINPGQHIKQSIKLSDRYSNTAQVIGKCDTVVFWSYKPDKETGDSQRLSGAILLPGAH